MHAEIHKFEKRQLYDFLTVTFRKSELYFATLTEATLYLGVCRVQIFNHH